MREPRPSGTKFDDLERYREQTAHLVGIAQRADVFDLGWEDAVLDTTLRQHWRDHLLALSMREQPQWTDQTRYVLLYPSRNPGFRDVAERYESLLMPGDRSFQAVAIDDVLDAAFAHGGPTKERFRRRYLWWFAAG